MAIALHKGNEDEIRSLFINANAAHIRDLRRHVKRPVNISLGVGTGKRIIPDLVSGCGSPAAYCLDA
jgi:hypothetical protein